MTTKLIAFLLFTSSFILDSYAGSATWNLSPTSSDWNTAANWTPATVPDGSSDVAIFDSSNTTTVTFSYDVTLNGIVFNSAASPFAFLLGGSGADTTTVTIGDGGVINDTRFIQSFFVAGANPGGHFGVFILSGSGSLGG